MIGAGADLAVGAGASLAALEKESQRTGRSMSSAETPETQKRNFVNKLNF
jgi:hypothetical protein